MWRALPSWCNGLDPAAYFGGMTAEKTMVLDHERVQRKLARIAHQLHEEHHVEKRLVLIGIAPRGIQLAERLATILGGISALDVVVMALHLDKDDPMNKPFDLKGDAALLKKTTVVLVDDVLESGRTLMHAAAHLVKYPMKRLTTVVLVDRRHRTFPIRADIVGLTLSTTLQERIHVELGKRDAVYLT